MTEPMTGRVLQVNVSPGGVPKLPVEEAWVDRFGLAGDAHHDDTTHGGPHRAVSLFAIEAIRRVAAEGHPIAPGSCGENLTIEGIELSRLAVGTRLTIGDELELELSKPDGPCETIAGSFLEGRIARISIKTHPADSRMYARVLRDGSVRPGDAIRLLPPLEGSIARAHVLMERVDAAKRASDLERWRVAEAAGYRVEILDDAELAVAISHDLPGPAFNRANGLSGLPNLLPRVLALFQDAGTPGWLPMDEPPWPEATPTIVIATHAAPPDRILERAEAGNGAGGVEVHRIGPDEADAWAEIMTAVSDLGGAPAEAWRRIVPGLVAAPGHHLVLAMLDGRPVGVGLVVVRKAVGLMRSAGVLPVARGRGIQRALIAARARLALDAGADLIAAGTAPDAHPSVRNLERLGFERIWTRPYYRYDPSVAVSVADPAEAAAG